MLRGQSPDQFADFIQEPGVDGVFAECSRQINAAEQKDFRQIREGTSDFVPDQEDIRQSVKYDLGQQNPGHEREADKAELPDQRGGKKTERKSQPAAEERKKQVAFPKVSRCCGDQPEQEPVFQDIPEKSDPGKVFRGKMYQAVFCLISKPENSVRAAEIGKQNTEKEQAQKQEQMQIPPVIPGLFYFI